MLFQKKIIIIIIVKNGKTMLSNRTKERKKKINEDYSSYLYGYKREKKKNIYIYIYIYIYIISQTCCKEWVKDKKRSIVERKETVRISHVCHRNSAVKEKEKKTQ
jgi:hypothetical protein